MDEYINRDAVHDLVRSLTKYAWASPVRNEQRVTVDADDVQFGVDKIPSADVAPVRHGRWVNEQMIVGGFAETWACDCSVCGRTQREPLWKPNYCPNCGAKMEKMDLKEEQHELRRDL